MSATTETTEHQHAYGALLDHLTAHQDCFPGSCPEGDALRQAEREAR